MEFLVGEAAGNRLQASVAFQKVFYILLAMKSCTFPGFCVSSPYRVSVSGRDDLPCGSVVRDRITLPVFCHDKTLVSVQLSLIVRGEKFRVGFARLFQECPRLSHVVEYNDFAIDGFRAARVLKEAR